MVQDGWQHIDLRGHAGSVQWQHLPGWSAQGSDWDGYVNSVRILARVILGVDRQFLLQTCDFRCKAYFWCCSAWPDGGLGGVGV